MGKGRKKEHTERVFSRVSPQVRERLKRFASRNAITESEAIRWAIERLLLSEEQIECQQEKVQVLKEIKRELNRIGINLNQIARYVNVEKEIDREVAEGLAELSKSLILVLSELTDILQRERRYALPENGD
jgi:phosphate uptake regulator